LIVARASNPHHGEDERLLEEHRELARYFPQLLTVDRARVIPIGRSIARMIAASL